ncbi:MAG: GntR family transcriptional regulator [Chloroflexi bacterium]|nr:GntR family transcriptional regulator [Chloroflexota bacterium]
MTRKGKPLTARNLSGRIDRDSYEPAYAQLANILRRQVATGVFQPGDQLPSESQLVGRFDVSPMTVRRAINLLADQGVISTAQGRGTFVRGVELSTATFGLKELQSLFSNKPQTNVKLLEARVVTADERTARKLDIALGQRVVYIRRLLTIENQPAFYHREYVVYDPARPVVEAEMEVTSLQGLFTGIGETLLKRGELGIEATILNDEEARLLEVATPAAAFCIEHLFYDLKERPVSWGWFVCHSTRLRFTTGVGIPRLDGMDQPRKER